MLVQKHKRFIVTKTLLSTTRCYSFLFALCISALLAGCGEQSTDSEHVQRAKDFKDAQQIDAAVIELKNALGKNPDNVEARWLLGLAYLEYGEGENAEKELRRAMQRGMETDRVEPKLARALLYQQRYAEVLDNFAVQGKSSAAQAELLTLRGRAYAGLGKAEQAEESFTRVLEIDAKSVEALVGLAKLAIRGTDYEAAEQRLSQAFAISPQNTDALLAKARLAFELADYEAALLNYQAVLDLGRGGFIALLGRAEAAFELGRHDLALQDVTLILNSNPNVAMANYLGARISIKNGDDAGALEYLQRVLRVMPGHLPSLLLLGTLNSRLGNLNQARVNLLKLLGEVPGYLPAEKTLAAVSIRLGQPELAIERLEPFVAKAPKDALLLGLLGLAHKNAGNAGPARDFLLQAATINPRLPGLQKELLVEEILLADTNLAVKRLESMRNLGEPLDQAELFYFTAYMRDKQPQHAMEFAREFVSKKPTSPVGYNMLAVIHLTLGDVDEAEKFFLQALEKQPEHTPTAMNLALLYAREGDTEQAERLYRHVLSHDVQSTDAMLGLASIFSAQGDEEESWSWVEKAWHQDPDNIRTGISLAGRYLYEKKFLRAVEIAQALYTKHPGDPLVLKMLGTAHLLAGETTSALLYFERLVDAQPDSSENHVLVAKVALQLDNMELAEYSIGRALEVNRDDPQALELKATIALGGNHFDEVNELASRIQNISPELAAGYLLEGAANAGKGNYKAAATAYQTAFEKSPDARVAVLANQYFVRSGNLQAAIEPLKAWLARNPDSVDVRFVLASTFQGLQDDELAIAEYHNILEDQPENIYALNNLASLYHRQNKAVGLEYAEKAFKLAANNPAVMDTLGWLLVDSGQLDRGIALLRDAVLKAPEVGEIRYHLAVAYKKAGNSQAAIKELKVAVNDARDFPEKPMAEKILATLLRPRRP